MRQLSLQTGLYFQVHIGTTKMHLAELGYSYSVTWNAKEVQQKTLMYIPALTLSDLLKGFSSIDVVHQHFKALQLKLAGSFMASTKAPET